MTLTTFPRSFMPKRRLCETPAKFSQLKNALRATTQDADHDDAGDAKFKFPGIAPSSYVVLFHHADPVNAPSFVGRFMHQSLECAKAHIEEQFKRNRKLVSARVYKLEDGQLRRVGDARRRPPRRGMTFTTFTEDK